MDDNQLLTYLESNPRMIGVLFTMMLVLSQAGNAAAAAISTTSGP
jgi:hypothetical protein